MNANAPQVNQPHGFDPSTLVGLEIANGDIRVIEHLNHGSFSFVYRGECISTNSTYALKFMRKVDPTTREWRMQCMEFESHLRAHEHPGVVTLHRVVEHGDYIVLVLDYISGGDLLDAVLKQPSRYKGDEHRIRSTFGQMLRALKHTHDVGVVHRDLKLENFLVSEDLSEVYLADFGLATTSRVYEPVGSMPYVPPEYLREHVRPSPTMSHTACDVWAMGCLLYQLLTGVCPWKQASLSDPSYINYLRDRRTIFATYGHNLTRELQSLLIKALAPHPVDRLTVDQFLARYDALPTLYVKGKSLYTKRKRVPTALQLRTSSLTFSRPDPNSSDSASSSAIETPAIGPAPPLPFPKDEELAYLAMPGLFFVEESEAGRV